MRKNIIAIILTLPVIVAGFTWYGLTSEQVKQSAPVTVGTVEKTPAQKVQDRFVPAGFAKRVITEEQVAVEAAEARRVLQEAQSDPIAAAPNPVTPEKVAPAPVPVQTETYWPSRPLPQALDTVPLPKAQPVVHHHHHKSSGKFHKHHPKHRHHHHHKHHRNHHHG